MPRGTIKFYKEDGGYGFINCQSKNDLFFHIRDCAKNWIPEARESCEFEIGTNKKGPAAINVRSLRLPGSISPKTDPNPDLASSNQASSLPVPYHFADIDLSLAIADTPVWHDGHGANRRHTGKLRISLKALTPLLVGSAQYKLSEAAPEIRRCQIRNISLSSGDVKATKTLLEPLRLEDRRVALAGQSLNGMLRHSLGALLSAPMERVAERIYSYRPALYPDNRNARLLLLPAVIQQWNGANLKIKLILDSQCVYFSDSHFEKMAIEKEFSIGICSDYPDSRLRDISQPKGPCKHHLEYCDKKILRDCYLFTYCGGIDFCGILMEEFQKKHDKKKHGNKTNNAISVHKFAAVRASDYDCFMKTKDAMISENCIRHYIASLKQVQDTELGHLAVGHPLLTKKSGDEPAPTNAGERRTRQQIIDAISPHLSEQIQRWERHDSKIENQLIYVEAIKIDEDSYCIRSFGHNFQYRWRYVDSVRQHANQVRQILRPIAGECISGELLKHQPPDLLSGARLFHGYVSRRKAPSEAWREEGSDNIGKGDYQRLKGRIGCGFAIECGPDWLKGEIPDDHQRFLSGRDNDQFLIPLKPLGMSRPSALEHRLRQPDANTLCVKRHGDGAALLTYGDLPEVPGMDADEPAELAGREFYRHQPAAKNYPSCYEDEEHIASDQAPLGRYLSKPGRVFRFTLDFQDLRGWELGALLVAAFPDHYLPKLVNRLAEKKPDAAFSALQNKLAKLNALAKQNDQPTLAHKLGYGRPLGLGSVLLILDKMEILAADKEGMPTLNDVALLQPSTDTGSPSAVTRRDGVDLADCIEAFADKLLCPGASSGNEPTTRASAIEPGRLARHLERWSAVHRYAGLSKAAYPSKDGKIYTYHANIRWMHMKGRRQGVGDALRSPSALAEPNLNDLLDS